MNFQRSESLVIDYNICVIDYKVSKIFWRFFKCFKLLVIDYNILVIDYQRGNFKIICFERKVTWPNLCAFKSNLRIYLVNLTWISWIAWCLLELSMKTNLSWNQNLLELSWICLTVGIIKNFLNCLGYALLLASSKSSWICLTIGIIKKLLELSWICFTIGIIKIFLKPCFYILIPILTNLRHETYFIRFIYMKTT